MQELYRATDVPAARGSLVQVSMDIGDGVERKFGIYSMIEDPGSSLSASQFGDTREEGNMYKPDGEGARFNTPIQVRARDFGVDSVY